MYLQILITVSLTVLSPGQLQFPPTQQPGSSQFQNNPSPNPPANPALFPQHPLQTGPALTQGYGQPQPPSSGKLLRMISPAFIIASLF